MPNCPICRNSENSPDANFCKICGLDLRVINQALEKSAAEIQLCQKLQVLACEKRHFPHFAPESGVCWKCHRNIYQNYLLKKDHCKEEHLSMGADGSKPLTGCPHCNYSYCE